MLLPKLLEPKYDILIYYMLLLAAEFSVFRAMASNDENQKAFLERARALADLKFTYVVSCQVYGNQKKSGDIHNRSCYTNILQLMLKYVKVGLILMKYHDIFA